MIGGLAFGEGPRWHDGRLWYSDFHQRTIYAVDGNGAREAVHAGLPDEPSGLGWLPDGTLLAVFTQSRRVMRAVDPGRFAVHADLGHIATFHCNDMVVDARGNAYVGNFGYDLHGGADPAPADLALVRPDGSAERVARGLQFPNGSVVTPDGSTLIVGETGAGRFSAFPIAADGTLGGRWTWAEIPGAGPDGCCLDADGAIWFADAFGAQLVRVRQGGEVVERRATPMPVFACMLGGPGGRTLYALGTPDDHRRRVAGSRAGAIFATPVDSPHAGFP